MAFSHQTQLKNLGTENKAECDETDRTEAEGCPADKTGSGRKIKWQAER